MHTKNKPPRKEDRSLAKTATPRHNGTRTPNAMAHQTSQISQNLRNNAATELHTSSRAHAAEREWTPAHFDLRHVLSTRDKHQGARTLHDIQPSPAQRRLDGSCRDRTDAEEDVTLSPTPDKKGHRVLAHGLMKLPKMRRRLGANHAIHQSSNLTCHW